MAFITTNNAGDGERGVNYKLIKTQAAATKQYLTKQVAIMLQPTTDSFEPLAVIQHFGSAIDLLNGWAATPGLGQYAKDQEANPAYDVIAEFNAMIAAFTSVRDTLIGMFPKDANGFLLYQTLNPNGTISRRTFTAAQLAPAVAQINSAIATIA